jgi:hypothetical protein
VTAIESDKAFGLRAAVPAATATDRRQLRRRRVGAVAWTFVPPIVACVGTRLLVVAVSPGVGFFAFGGQSWARWDSHNYASIVRDGYYWKSCTTGSSNGILSVCSNTTWYPGYPYLIKVATWLGFPLDTSGVVLAVTFWVATVCALWVWFLRDAPLPRALACLVIGSCFPGVVYLQALFPISMLTFLTVVTIRLALRRRWWWAGGVAGLAGFVYPIGIVLIPAMVLWVLLARRDVPPTRRVVLAAAQGALAATGTLAVFVIHQIEVDNWHASLSMQKLLGTTLLNPIDSVLDIVVRERSWIQAFPGNPGTIADPIAHQTLLVTVLVFSITLAVVIAWRRVRQVDRDDVALLVLFWGIWLLPLASFIDTGIYRREATLLPITALSTRLPTPVALALGGACVYVAAQMSPHFFDARLI